MRLLTLRSILVAADLDPASSAALRTAARLASLAEAELHLVYATTAPEPDAVARLREHFRITCPAAGEPESMEVVSGVPAEAILKQAVTVDADVVVLGPHRRVGTDAPMGSTAARVVRTAPCPCLVAAADLRLPLQRVMAPIDLSSTAGGALSVAVTWTSALRQPGSAARLTALHVAAGADPMVLRRVQDEVERARGRAGGAAGAELVEQVITDSDPAAGIVMAAASADADLLVMGTRGIADASSGLGGVSAAVARSTPCPLLLVPPATWATQKAPWA